MPRSKQASSSSKKKSYTLLLALLILVVVVLLNESPYLSGKFAASSFSETWLISCLQQPNTLQKNLYSQGADLALEAGKSSCASACNRITNPNTPFSAHGLRVSLQISQCTPKDIQNLISGCLAQCQKLRILS